MQPKSASSCGGRTVADQQILPSSCAGFPLRDLSSGSKNMGVVIVYTCCILLMMVGYMNPMNGLSSVKVS